MAIRCFYGDPAFLTKPFFVLTGGFTAFCMRLFDVLANPRKGVGAMPQADGNDDNKPERAVHLCFSGAGLTKAEGSAMMKAEAQPVWHML